MRKLKINYSLNRDLLWKFVAIKNLSTVETIISIPATAREVLLFAGAPNPDDANQVWGGKMYILPNIESSRNIIYEKDIYNAAGTTKGTGFYVMYSANSLNTHITTGSVRLRIYYR